MIGISLHTVNPRIKDGRVVLDDISLTSDYFRSINKIYIVACGSAYHVGVVGKYVIEQMIRIPVEVIVASEFRYCNPIVDEKTLVVLISQSGETADTIAAMREAKRLGARTFAIVNAVGSCIARESDCNISYVNLYCPGIRDYFSRAAGKIY